MQTSRVGSFIRVKYICERDNIARIKNTPGSLPVWISGFRTLHHVAGYETTGTIISSQAATTAHNNQLVLRSCSLPTFHQA